MNKTVLIIEDDKSMQEILSVIIQKEGYKTLNANNGIEALELINNEQPDLIICDYYLPFMNGIEILKSLSSNEQTKDIPFIFLTGSTLYDLKNKIGNDYSVYRFLKKPIDKKELVTAINSLFI